MPAFTVTAELRVTVEPDPEGNDDMHADMQASSALEAAVATGLADGFTVISVDSATSSPAPAIW
jgi:hypothetical protein